MFKNFKVSDLISRKDERLFKVVYTKKCDYRNKTLLVTGKDSISAVKKFYQMAGLNDVEDIVEFTEIKYEGDGDKNDE